MVREAEPQGIMIADSPQSTPSARLLAAAKLKADSRLTGAAGLPKVTLLRWRATASTLCGSPSDTGL